MRLLNITDNFIWELLFKLWRTLLCYSPVGILCVAKISSTVLCQDTCNHAIVVKLIEKQEELKLDMKDHNNHTPRKIFSNGMAEALFMNWCTFSKNTPQTSSVGKTQRDLILFLSYFTWSTCKCKSWKFCYSNNHSKSKISNRIGSQLSGLRNGMDRAHSALLSPITIMNQALV